MAIEHIANRCLGCLVIQLQEFAFDLAISPPWILLCKAEDKVLKFLVYSRSPTLALVRIGPLPAYQFPVPAYYCFRLENADDITQLMCSFMGDLFQPGRKNGECHLFDPVWFYRFIAFALKNSQLVA